MAIDKLSLINFLGLNPLNQNNINSVKRIENNQPSINYSQYDRELTPTMTGSGVGDTFDSAAWLNNFAKY